jgi:hypothetical protein
VRRLTTKQASELLGVDLAVKPVDLTKRWKFLARECHPDLFPGDAEKEKRFRLLNTAYQLLSNLQVGTRAARALEEEVLDDEFSSWLKLLSPERREKVLQDLRSFMEDEQQ